MKENPRPENRNSYIKIGLIHRMTLHLIIAKRPRSDNSISGTASESNHQVIL